MDVSFFYHAMFIVTILSCMVMYQPAPYERIVCAPRDYTAVILMLAVAVVLASLPVPWHSGADRELYASQYIWQQKGFISKNVSDRLFTLYMNLCGTVMTYKGWLWVTALIYCFNHYIFSRRIVKGYVYVVLLMFFSSFMFYGYGTNTIRAGFAASFLLLALSFYEKPILFFGFILIAIGCHASMLLPSVAMIVAKYNDRKRLFLYIWFFSIILSATLGHYFEILFSSLAFDSRLSYLNVAANETHYEVGFRLDFILYSCMPVLAGYYYVVKKNFEDKLYSLLFNTYILANTFWILVIRANFSDRFAYLSWFLYPIVLIYPLLKERLVGNQEQKIVVIVFLHELFTYIMFLR